MLSNLKLYRKFIEKEKNREDVNDRLIGITENVIAGYSCQKVIFINNNKPELVEKINERISGFTNELEARRKKKEAKEMKEQYDNYKNEVIETTI